MDAEFALLALQYLKSQKQTADTAKAETVEPVEVEVSKAIEVVKAWSGPNGNVIVEGWISTPTRDIQGDKVEPEAFQKSLPSYMARMAPLSVEHRMQGYLPIGHVQKAALVRDGSIFFESDHPTDSAPFEHFPGVGTGVYGRAVVNDPQVAGQVMKGNIGGFSWTGRVLKVPLRNGGSDFVSVEAYRETTIAAYPVNPDAAIVAASKE